MDLISFSLIFLLKTINLLLLYTATTVAKKEMKNFDRTLSRKGTTLKPYGYYSPARPVKTKKCGP